MGGALITGISTLRAKRAEYANEYYKLVLAKRLSAYEQLEILISYLKTSFHDGNGRLYHLLFASEANFGTAYQVISAISSKGLWLSEEAFSKVQELNYGMLQNKLNADTLEFAKRNYEAIAKFREDLERIVAADMMELHNVHRFLSRKKKTPNQQFITLVLPASNNSDLP